MSAHQTVAPFGFVLNLDADRGRLRRPVNGLPAPRARDASPPCWP